MGDPSAARSAAPPLLVVVGPTASGKTELACRLCAQHDGEVVSADSVQIYRHFDLGSGKPSPEERRQAPHHLVDAVDPLEPMDAARFVAMADAAIADIHARGRTAVVCGGTFLWVKALLRGLAPMPPADPVLRARHEAVVAEEGPRGLHARLESVDPEAAQRLSPNDVLRVGRALEVFALSGTPQTEWHRRHQFRHARYAARMVAVARSREGLEARIRARVARWLEAGWVDQVKQLKVDGFGTARAMDAVGFRQIGDHLRGALAADALEDAIVRATRRFARRQRTWLRDEPIEYI
ncbi:MAG: tRNA (adenosine(37)-N6)-dimethylallyltransferase MiaA [Myxococcota bacterium]